MAMLSPQEATGHLIELRRTDPRHLGGGPASRIEVEAPQRGPSAEKSFSTLFVEALDRVSDLQLRSEDLSRQMITDPESVNVHDVTIALAEANLALSMAKGIIDRAIRAYNEILNIR